MSIRVKIHTMFQPATGGAGTIELNNCKTVGDCLTALRILFPELGKMLFDGGDKIAGFLVILVNGENLTRRDNEFAYPVKDGDEIFPILMIEGG